MDNTRTGTREKDPSITETNDRVGPCDKLENKLQLHSIRLEAPKSRTKKDSKGAREVILGLDEDDLRRNEIAATVDFRSWAY